MGSQYSALDFEFLYVKDLNEKDAMTTTVTSEDNLPKINVWVLQDPEKIDLLNTVLKPEHLDYLSAAIVLDLDQPWEMMNALNRWMSLLDQIVRPLFSKLLPTSRQDEIKGRIATHILNYERVDQPQQTKAPEEENKGKELEEREASAVEEEVDLAALKSMLPLPDGVLKSNLGIPITVVCHKIDLLTRGEKGQALEQHIDFIQKNVRAYCLTYGAAMIFTEIH